MFQFIKFSLFLLLFLFLNQSVAKNDTKKNNDACLLGKLKIASPHTTVAEIKAECSVEISEKKDNLGLISKRFLAEKESEFNSYVLTPHMRNYILPFTITDDFNYGAYNSGNSGGLSDNFVNKEAKFQLSIKVPLNSEDLFFDNDELYFGMTLVSWWQIYASDISKPFRETNYKPEIFYLTPTKWHPFGGNLGLGVGFEHQSNGRSQFLSRSWNRFYGQIMFEKNNFVMALRPWYRIKEEMKDDPLDPIGDDNPDIEDYMGHFELYTGYKWDRLEMTGMFRQNFSTGNGAFQLEATYPLWGRLLGYVQYFNGYGESLIDYNHSQQKVGIGFALTNYF
jgi:phospholipase A1